MSGKSKDNEKLKRIDFLIDEIWWNILGLIAVVIFFLGFLFMIFLNYKMHPFTIDYKEILFEVIIATVGILVCFGEYISNRFKAIYQALIEIKGF